MSAKTKLGGLRKAAATPGEKLRDWWDGAPGWARWTVYGLLFVGALLLPYSGLAPIMSPDAKWSSILFYPIGVYILLAIGLNVVVGYAGLLDLGYVAFWAVGAYSMAVLGAYYGWSFWEIMPIGIVLAAISGVILGAPTLRLRGDYLAIVTLGFGEIIRKFAENNDYLRENRGIENVPRPPDLSTFEIGGVKILEYGVRDARPYYYMLVVLIAIIIIMVKRLENSRVGRAWSAIREDEDAAELMGVPTFRFKLLAFALGAAIGGAAGVLWASKTTFVAPDSFPFILSATILAAVVLGGSGNLVGVIVGAFLIAWLPERFRGAEEYRELIFGAAIVLMMIWRPEGLIPSRRRKAELKEGGGGSGHLGAEVAEVGK